MLFTWQKLCCLGGFSFLRSVFTLLLGRKLTKAIESAGELGNPGGTKGWARWEKVTCCATGWRKRDFQDSSAWHLLGMNAMGVFTGRGGGKWGGPIRHPSSGWEAGAGGWPQGSTAQLCVGALGAAAAANVLNLLFPFFLCFFSFPSVIPGCLFLSFSSYFLSF